MKAYPTLLAALLLGTASAQTTIGNVTITRPSDVPSIQQNTQKRAPVVTPPSAARTAAPASSSAATTNRTPRTANNTQAQPSAGQAKAAAASDLPKGWRQISGRVLASGGDVRLPAGSKVVMSIEELAPNLAWRSTYLRVEFGSTSLSTPYTLQFSPQRFRSGSRYAVRAKVYNARGHLLYANQTLYPVPDQRTANLNITVHPQ